MLLLVVGKGVGSEAVLMGAGCRCSEASPVEVAGARRVAVAAETGLSCLPVYDSLAAGAGTALQQHTSTPTHGRRQHGLHGGNATNHCPAHAYLGLLHSCMAAPWELPTILGFGHAAACCCCLQWRNGTVSAAVVLLRWACCCLHLVLATVCV